MRMVRLLAAAIVLLFLPMAGAQAPTTALEIDGGPTTDVVSTRGVAIVSFNVTLRIANVVCSGASTFSVDVLGGAEQQVATGDDNATLGNATVHVTPATLNFPIGTGPYGSNPGLPAGQPYEATQSMSVAIESPGLPNETAYEVTVNGKLRPSSAPNCRGTAAAPEATSTTSFIIRFNETDAMTPTSPAMPIPWFVAPLAAIAAVLTFRRRLA